MACATEVGAAESCVAGGACAECITGTFEDWIKEYENEYKRTVAFEAPGTDLFCERSQFYVCEVLKTSNCCCTAELEAYSSCAYTNELNALFSVDCPYNGCSGGGAGGEEGGGGGGGSSMIIIIAAVAVVILCGGGGFCWYRRRKRRLAEEDKVSLFLFILKASKVTWIHFKLTPYSLFLFY